MRDSGRYRVKLYFQSELFNFIIIHKWYPVCVHLYPSISLYISARTLRESLCIVASYITLYFCLCLQQHRCILRCCYIFYLLSISLSLFFACYSASLLSCYSAILTEFSYERYDGRLNYATGMQPNTRLTLTRFLRSGWYISNSQGHQKATHFSINFRKNSINVPQCKHGTHFRTYLLIPHRERVTKLVPNAYTTLTQRVHNAYTTRTQRVHNAYTTRTL